jgi:uncharacterized protein DUF4190/uncharacterized protein DUF1707
MTAGGYGYGHLRATDADRENVRQILTDAHAQGRLDWQEFDARSTALLHAQTYDQLAALTVDLPSRIPAAPPQVYQPVPGGGPGSTNGLAIGSLICGIGQFFGFWLLGTIPAIVLGHLARRQIRQTREQGDGMALAGLVLGYIGVGLTVILLIILLIILVAASQTSGGGTGVVPGG